MKHILETDDQTSNKIPYGDNLRRIFDSCMNLDEVNERGASPAQAFIKDNFGGWAWDADNTAIQFKVSTTQPEVWYH